MIRPAHLSLVALLAACSTDPDHTPADATAPDAPAQDAAADARADVPSTDTPSIDASPTDVTTDVTTTDVTTTDVTTTSDVAADVPVAMLNCDRAMSATELRAGVARIDSTGLAVSSIVSFGPGAFPVLLDADRSPYAAASCAGAGRVVSVGHEALLFNQLTSDDRGRFVHNAIDWLARGRTAVIGLDGDQAALRTYLTGLGYTVRVARVTDLSGINVWITTHYTDRTSTERDAIAAYLAAGNGILSGGHGWYWASTHPGVSLDRFAGNVLLSPMGLFVTRETDVDAGTLSPASTAPVALDQSRDALEAIFAHVAGTTRLSMPDLVLASNAVRRALRALSVNSPYLMDARARRGMLPTVVPTAARPVTPATQPVEALALTLDSKLALELPPAEVTTHPAAADFPGLPSSGAASTTLTATVDGTYAGRESGYLYADARGAVWRSIGAYVPPGTQVTVTLSSNATMGGVTLLVGQHTDTLWSLASWPRVPEITRAFAVTETTTTVASAFGGPLYIRIAPGSALGPITVSARNVIPMPRWVQGSTTATQWQESLRTTASPWAEVGTDKLVLHVPTSAVRAVSDPTALMAWWDRVLDSHADLASIPRVRVRAERAVVDREISAGYMHSGYPIMAHLESAAAFVNLPALMTSGEWGLFHELGHNHQWADWVLPGTTEANVNLYSTHAMEEVVGLAPRTGHPALTPTMRDARIRAYIAGGRNFTRDWNVWTALETYLQLQETFGWAPLTRLFAEYRGLAMTDRPSDDAARIQQWVVRSSRAVGRNLVDFYTAWGFSITDATRAAVTALPAWTDHPMTRY